MRTNFYICWGNRDKYFDWRLKTVKFNTKQQNTDTIWVRQDTTSSVSHKIQLGCFLLGFHFLEAEQDIADTNSISSLFW